jgi:shikimate kinase
MRFTPGVHTPRQYRNIALVGFMGVGKSTVGQVLAAILGFEFYDTDRVIETRAGKKISDIFAQDGEARFRAMESELARELEARQGMVISTGGGLVVNPDNMASLKKHALVVCLWASPAVIFNRVRHQVHRPLLQTPDPEAKIMEMLELRRPAYQQADVLVGVDFRSAGDTARHLAQSFRRLTQGRETAPAQPAKTGADPTAAKRA